MISLQISDEIVVKKISLPEERLAGAAQLTLKSQGADENTALSIVITGNEEIRELNRDYRDVDAPTDVLSFESHEKDPETGEVYLGDIIISYERALENLAEHGTTIDEELILLVVHGVLHLLGFDHGEDEEKTRMWKVQEDILQHMGISPNLS
jgi:probable rRNA maturation factor